MPRTFADGVRSFLYSSSDVRQAIIKLFSSAEGRRVAISAFVGEGAEAYLPHPKGLELVCWPKAGGTNPAVLRKLMKLGVKVFFSDSLHIKVYWAKGRGAVVCSANLSTNALGAGNLKEAGILLHPEEIEIDRLLSGLKPRNVSRSELLRLDRLHKVYLASNRIRAYSEQVSFCDWYESAHRPEWRIAFWEETAKGTPQKVKATLQKEYGLDEPEQQVFASQRVYREGDWVLTAKLRKRSISDAGWLFVDRTEKVSPSDKEAYDPECQFDHIQIWPLHRYPAPPFRLDRAFRESLSKAALEFKQPSLWEVFRPPSRLVDRIYAFYGRARKSQRPKG
jgi:hypothetical protein